MLFFLRLLRTTQQAGPDWKKEPPLFPPSRNYQRGGKKQVITIAPFSQTRAGKEWDDDDDEGARERGAEAGMKTVERREREERRNWGAWKLLFLFVGLLHNERKLEGPASHAAEEREGTVDVCRAGMLFCLSGYS